MKRFNRTTNSMPAMASEPFLGQIIIFLYQLIRILLSFVGFPQAS